MQIDVSMRGAKYVIALTRGKYYIGEEIFDTFIEFDKRINELLTL